MVEDNGLSQQFLSEKNAGQGRTTRDGMLRSLPRLAFCALAAWTYGSDGASPQKLDAEDEFSANLFSCGDSLRNSTADVKRLMAQHDSCSNNRPSLEHSSCGRVSLRRRIFLPDALLILPDVGPRAAGDIFSLCQICRGRENEGIGSRRRSATS
jgi:hypothetical protein